MSRVSVSLIAAALWAMAGGAFAAPPPTDVDAVVIFADTDVRVVVAEDAETAGREIADADAAFGWLTQDLLAKAKRIRWLQAP